MTAAGIDTDNNQLKAVVEAVGAEILVAMATATTAATVTDGDSSNDDDGEDSIHNGGGGDSCQHSGGMAAGVTPADIRAALAGAAVLQRCWGASRGSRGCLVLAGMLLVACGRLSCCRFTSLGMTLLLCSLCRLLCWHARRLGCC